ncbi:CDP-glycerol glycerophosphotransferase family protein, partial [Methanobrevibacter filiformis]|uniref:CDP-glycerol glycerophosphotransferase family protein n=1 Tax=Methanobrevibacter filiformis TaxID=55758 RepID=UPI001FDF752A
MLDKSRMDKLIKLNKRYEKLYKSNIHFRRSTDYTKYFKQESLEDSIIFYETFHGKSMTDNPFALFLEIVSRDKKNRFTHVWAINHEITTDPQIQRFKNMKNLKFVKVHSEDYFIYLSKAKYLINNTSFSPYFMRKEGQIYINTWHGTPLKTLGKDMKGPIAQHKNLQRNFLQSTHILSPNSFTTEKLIDSHDLNGIWDGLVVEEGYPRVDLIINTNKEEYLTKVLSKVLSETVNLESKKIVLYAPTWRGNVGNLKNNSNDLFDTISLIQETLPEDYNLLLKVHPLMYKHILKDKRFSDICVPDYLDVSEVLAVTDVLITDYSSILIDYFVTNKPIILYQYDQDEYLDRRGLYIDFDELNIPITKSSEDLTKILLNINSLAANYNGKEKFISLQNGNCSSKVVDAIFENKTGFNLRKFKNNKKNSLFILENFSNKDFYVKKDVINFQDFDELNVIVLTKDKFNKDESKKLSQLDSRVKIFYRVGITNVDKNEWIQYRYILNNPKYQGLINIANSIFSRELDRLIPQKYISITNLTSLNNWWVLLSYYAQYNKTEKSIYLPFDYVVNELNGKIDKETKKLIEKHDMIFSNHPLVKEVFPNNSESIIINCYETKMKKMKKIQIENEKYFIIQNDEYYSRTNMFLINEKIFSKEKVFLFLIDDDKKSSLSSKWVYFLEKIYDEKFAYIFYATEELQNLIKSTDEFENITFIPKNTVKSVFFLFSYVDFIINFNDFFKDFKFLKILNNLSENNILFNYDTLGLIKKYFPYNNTYCHDNLILKYLYMMIFILYYMKQRRVELDDEEDVCLKKMVKKE